jgi:GntR family transcriptional regulator
VQHFSKLGLLQEGDQLPTVKDLAERLAINPNTVLKAYRELEHNGFVNARSGVGTFMTRTKNDVSPEVLSLLCQELQHWFARARRAGLDDEGIEALFRNADRRVWDRDDRMSRNARKP